jgi:hypothetical protein
MNKFWETEIVKFDRSVLVIPNYTYFGPDKNINSDSFVLVMKSFLNNSDTTGVKFIIPYPTGFRPTDFMRYPNVELVDMGVTSTYPPMMRIQFPVSGFKRILGEYQYDVIWSHLPEWTNQVLVAKGFRSGTHPIYGYCHWWEIPENGAFEHNSFWNNIQGILKMEECGVNSQWVKNLVIKRASLFLNDEMIAKLDKIIQPWYLGCDTFVRGTPIPKTILFNHRDDAYTGAQWFFEEMDKLWSKRQDFKVLTSIASVSKPYTQSIRHPDREQYLNNVGSADVGVGCFTKYSAWSMSTTDGLSRGVPYILPKGLCYEEMVGDDYPLMYRGKREFVNMLTDYLDGKLVRVDTKSICDRLQWHNSLKNWKI